MKKNRQELENTLLNIVKKHNSDKKIKMEVAEKLKEHNIAYGKVMGFFNNPMTIQDKSVTPDAELYLFTNTLYEATLKSEYKIKSSEWFNEEEIKNYSLYKTDIKDEKHIVVINNAIQIASNQWMAFSPSQIVYEWSANGQLTYNFRTQRESQKIKFNDEIVEKAKLKKQSVKAISNRIKTKQQKQNTVSLNIRKTETEDFDYNEKLQQLTIYVDNENTFLDIVDGQHRISGSNRAVKDNQNIEFGFILSIFNETEEEMQDYIAQEDEHNHIARVRVQSFKSDEGIEIAKNIAKFRTNKTNELFDKLAYDYDEVKFKGKYATFETFGRAIEYNFKSEIEKGAREVNNIQEYIVDFFNELIGILKETDIVKNSLELNNSMFIGYIALASKLYKKDNWKKILENTINQIDFSEHNIKWDNLGIIKKTSPKINKPFIRNISNYFIKLVEIKEVV